MNRKDALRIVLIDVCCSNGNNFCQLCPLRLENACKDFSYDESKLLEAVVALNVND